MPPFRGPSGWLCMLSFEVGHHHLGVYSEPLISQPSCGLRTWGPRFRLICDAPNGPWLDTASFLPFSPVGLVNRRGMLATTARPWRFRCQWHSGIMSALDTLHPAAAYGKSVLQNPFLIQVPALGPGSRRPTMVTQIIYVPCDAPNFLSTRRFFSLLLALNNPSNVVV